MVEHAQRQLRSVDHVQVGDVTPRLDQAEKRERAVEHSDVALCRDQRDGAPAQPRRSDDEALIADPGQVAVAGEDDRPVLGGCPADRSTEETRQPALKLPGGGVERR